MKPKTKNTIRIIYIVICFLGGLGAIEQGFLGVISGIILIAAGLIMIPQITDLIPILQGKGTLTLVASIVLFLAGGAIMPKTESPSEEVSPDRAIPIATEIVETTTVEETTTTTTVTTTEITTTETTTSETTTIVTTTETTTSETTTTTTTETVSVTDPPQVVKTQPVSDWIINTDTGKFHYPSCRDVDRMDESNKWYYTGTYNDVTGMGYSPCGHCHPRG